MQSLAYCIALANRPYLSEVDQGDRTRNQYSLFRDSTEIREFFSPKGFQGDVHDVFFR